MKCDKDKMHISSDSIFNRQVGCSLHNPVSWNYSWPQTHLMQCPSCPYAIRPCRPHDLRCSSSCQYERRPQSLISATIHMVDKPLSAPWTQSRTIRPAISFLQWKSLKCCFHPMTSYKKERGGGKKPLSHIGFLGQYDYSKCTHMQYTLGKEGKLGTSMLEQTGKKNSRS